MNPLKHFIGKTVYISFVEFGENDEITIEMTANVKDVKKNWLICTQDENDSVFWVNTSKILYLTEDKIDFLHLKINKDYKEGDDVK